MRKGVETRDRGIPANIPERADCKTTVLRLSIIEIRYQRYTVCQGRELRVGGGFTEGGEGSEGKGFD